MHRSSMGLSLPSRKLIAKLVQWSSCHTTPVCVYLSFFVLARKGKTKRVSGVPVCVVSDVLVLPLVTPVSTSSLQPGHHPRKYTKGVLPYPFRPIRTSPDQLNLLKSPEIPDLRRGPTDHGPGPHWHHPYLVGSHTPELFTSQTYTPELTDESFPLTSRRSVPEFNQFCRDLFLVFGWYNVYQW